MGFLSGSASSGTALGGAGNLLPSALGVDLGGGEGEEEAFLRLLRRAERSYSGVAFLEDSERGKGLIQGQN